MSWLIRSRKANQVCPSSNGSGASILSSASSMTPSQLDATILDMLNVSHDTGRFVNICEGNPLTSKGKRIQLMKMIMIAMVPLAILLGLTANVFAEMILNHNQIQGLRNVVYFSTEVGHVLNQVQRERDMSALYVSVIGQEGGAESKALLMKQYPTTDIAVVNLSYWPADAVLIKRKSEFQTREMFQNYINLHRYSLDSSNSTLTDELSFYSEIVNVFLEWLIKSVTEVPAGKLWQHVVAYFEILQSKDNFGMERGLGTIFFTQGYFDRLEDYLSFLENQDQANTTFGSARYFSPLVDKFYEHVIANNATFNLLIQTMRAEVRSNNASEVGSIERGKFWHELMSLYLQHLQETQMQLGNSILSLLDAELQEDEIKMAIIASIFALVIIMCPIILNAVYALTSAIQSYSLTLAARTKALNREKRRTDTLLYQMLPKQVADQLKRNEIVDAEIYSEVTIFFSDIVGFTEISARCSPIQVVNMLNSLYTCFDRRIALYDVYKVETIGDAYMVVSGLPNRNGQQHSTEIATMALDLLDHINLLEIPHLPGTIFRLRIGCHMGPVITGVVGKKMPRYCLFGETVSIASKMEALGKPCQVHLSESSYLALNAVGGFVMVKREENVVKGDPVLEDAWRGEQVTYWLMDRQGMARKHVPSYSDDEDFENGSIGGPGTKYASLLGYAKDTISTTSRPLSCTGSSVSAIE
ncbi:uncharacterized protein LOC141899152 [Tubulanus polymorphus]|uniref:uncharacterized protein LOC141899152 n=1 Tax=Tubulanus polymorphus TaxID=672921 RepID=UPI003DA3E7CF